MEFGVDPPYKPSMHFTNSTYDRLCKGKVPLAAKCMDGTGIAI
jgi:hypothetical protein